jgi:hypothetical protein
VADSRKLIGEGRALKVCDACGGVDDHPRHMILGPPDTAVTPTADVVNAVFDNLARLKALPEDRNRLLAELYDTAAIERHLDCCREAGCPIPAGEPGSCYDQTAGAEDKRGGELLEHLMSAAPAARADSTGNATPRRKGGDR